MSILNQRFYSNLPKVHLFGGFMNLYRANKNAVTIESFNEGVVSSLADCIQISDEQCWRKFEQKCQKTI